MKRKSLTQLVALPLALVLMAFCVTAAAARLPQQNLLVLPRVTINPQTIVSQLDQMTREEKNTAILRNVERYDTDLLKKVADLLADEESMGEEEPYGPVSDWNQGAVVVPADGAAEALVYDYPGGSVIGKVPAQTFISYLVICNGGYVIVFGKEFDKAWDNGENMGYMNMADIAFVAVATQAPGK